ERCPRWEWNHCPPSVECAASWSQPGGEHDIILWDDDEASSANTALQVDLCAPGFVAFAGNGGGEVFAFDMAGAVFMLPIIGMEPGAATKVAGDFLELARGFKREITPGE
ncbi:MAG: hypothetical protein V4794_00455, partial [Pseudomonadota bacterium]